MATVFRIPFICDISAEKARQLLDEGAQLIDVRSAREFAGGHIAGARNIPLDELEGRLAELGERNRPTILYCHSGMRSWRGTKLLRKAGFTAACNLGPMVQL
ncbi:MAG: rhodanese-like domain-containing protein [Deltaproteobacteria bacterium]|nr:rhodanese-like domain-containing protein [Deltaproteobacteria bacterium]